MTRYFVSTAYRIGVSGLKPGTVHNFTFNGVQKNADCRQVGKALGEPLISTAEGKLEFDLHISGDKETEYVKLIRTNYGFQASVGALGLDEHGTRSDNTLKVASADNSSYATIIVKVQVHYLEYGSTIYNWFQYYGNLQVDPYDPYFRQLAGPATSYDSTN